MFQKIPPQFHDKAVQSNILWMNLHKISEVSILQLAHKQGNPSFHFHVLGSKCRYPCTQTALAVPKSFPCLLQFCTGYRIWHASQVWKRKTSEKHWFTYSKKYADTTNIFSLFLDKFLETYLPPIYCSLTCSHTSTFFLATIGHFLTLEWFSTTEWPVLWMCVPYLQKIWSF